MSEFNINNQYSYHYDYYRMTGDYYKPGLKTFIMRHLFHNLQFAYYFRKYQRHKSLKSRLILYRISRKYGLEISLSAKIGKGLYIGHPYNITIGSGVVLGDNVNLHKGCTIGKANRGKRIGTPIIGNRVYVGINSTIVGNVHIGNDVLIAPNSYVNIDIPDHSIVVGNPATIYPRENATEDYVVYVV